MAEAERDATPQASAGAQAAQAQIPEAGIDVDLWRRRLAGVVLHGHLAGRQLPERIEGLTGDALVDRIARMEAKEVLETLREIYEIDHWDLESFERVFVDGALAGWKPGAIVQETPDRLRIISHSCPIANDVDRDGRACAMCQQLQTHAVRLALRGDVEDAAFHQLMSRGEGACELDVKIRPRSRQGDTPR